jgi:hypothetical protein
VWFETFMNQITNITVLWCLTPCSLVDIYRRFWGVSFSPYSWQKVFKVKDIFHVIMNTGNSFNKKYYGVDYQGFYLPDKSETHSCDLHSTERVVVSDRLRFVFVIMKWRKTNETNLQNYSIYSNRNMTASLLYRKLRCSYKICLKQGKWLEKVL